VGTAAVVEDRELGPELSSPSSPSSPCSPVVLDVGATPGANVSGTTTGATLVDVVVLVGLVVVLAGGVVVGAGSSGTAGFCHTDCLVGAPRLGNRLSRTAYTAPTDPTTTTAMTMATDQAPVIQNLGRREFERAAGPAPSPGPEGAREKTGSRRDGSSPCPWSSQLSVTTPL
jgi:hypothetical protein